MSENKNTVFKAQDSLKQEFRRSKKAVHRALYALSYPPSLKLLSRMILLARLVEKGGQMFLSQTFFFSYWMELLGRLATAACQESVSASPV
jgi:hypothetical protein